MGAFSFGAKISDFWYTCSVAVACSLVALLRSPSPRTQHNVSITASFAALVSAV
jgi:hypothetical protein